MILLETNKLTKAFGNNFAVREADISLEAGKIYGLLGPNGSGKSTFMKMVAGLFYPKSGKINILGIPVCLETKKSVAYMCTEIFFYKYMSIKKVGEFYKDFYEDFDEERYEKLINFMELRMDMKIKALSSGMAAKLKVAVTMSRNARIFMLDEPLNGIDIIAREKILNAIIEQSNEGNVILISSHLVDEMENILDNVIFIKQGDVVLQCTTEKLREEDGVSIVEKYKEVYANA